jgi:hypothetical protein
MSTQPISIDRPTPAELRARRTRASRRSDALYIGGAILVAAGLGCIRFYLAPIALGAFCLVFPVLELVTGFLRGLRSPAGARRRL